MDDPRDPALQDSAMLRKRIASTRARITERLKTLEAQVLGIVATAQKTVQTFETVKSSIQERAGNVKATIDLRRHVQRHPWAIIGGFFLVGLAAGRFGLNAPRLKEEESQSRPGPNGANLSEPRQKQAARPSWTDTLCDEIDEVKALAVGYLANLVGDWLKQKLIQLDEQFLTPGTKEPSAPGAERQEDPEKDSIRTRS